jgi:hypothetical protein
MDWRDLRKYVEVYAALAWDGYQHEGKGVCHRGDLPEMSGDLNERV